MTEGVSPLGRYAPEDRADETRHDVRLLATPVLLLAASRARHDGLLRECRLLALGGRLPADPSGRLAELVEVLGRRFAAPAVRPDREVDEALARGQQRLDLEYRLTRGAAEAAQALQDVLDTADDLCAAGLLMTLPRTPDERRFGQWWVDELDRQTRGQAPTPWPGPWPGTAGP